MFVDRPSPGNFVWILLESTDEPAIWLDLETGNDTFERWRGLMPAMRRCCPMSMMSSRVPSRHRQTAPTPNDVTGAGRDLVPGRRCQRQDEDGFGADGGRRRDQLAVELPVVEQNGPRGRDDRTGALRQDIAVQPVLAICRRAGS